ncbi:MFS transporter [Psychrobacillus psychrodurans]|jgi:DHA1 family multidrug resistance protein-like MFS transporter|uniref:MFS transporter n=1 Tax=Psychrobacillus TaxID=1221880 RepID=UPI0008DFFA61|nr:MFS transporter [Psychrobacillus psychrodurans]MCK1996335.1 MFS transporter [Psychrobacillus psychrodurans]MCZ8539365.1 MFS transporter [Psychrobacillus psychrodurans]SFM37335.1 MFS transporter, DHA1 family, multidrug resistance protein [Psychrobacillus psychrodurans]
MTKKTNNSALYILMFNMFIAMSGIGLVIPVMPQYLETFGVAGQALGFIIASFAFGQFLFSPLAGDLSDTLGRKKLIIVGLIIFSASQLWFGLATHEWMLYSARFISGIGGAFLVPATMAFVADITTLEERGKGMGFLGASMSLGFMIGPALGGFLAKVSLTFPFYMASIAAVIAAVVSVIILPDIKNAISETPPEPKKRENILTQMKNSLKTPYFMMLVIIFVFTFGIANFQTTFSLYVDHKYNYTPQDIAVVLTVGGFIGVIVQTLVVEKLFKRFGELNVILVNLVVAAIAFLLFFVVDGFALVLVVASIFSTATTLIRPAVNTVISKLAGNEQGFAAGMNNAYMSLGSMIGPALAGMFFDININYPFIVGSVILLASWAITLVWIKRKKPVV